MLYFFTNLDMKQPSSKRLSSIRRLSHDNNVKSIHSFPSVYFFMFSLTENAQP